MISVEPVDPYLDLRVARYFSTVGTFSAPSSVTWLASTELIKLKASFWWDLVPVLEVLVTVATICLR